MSEELNDKLARELAEKWKNRTHEDCVKWENGTDGTFVGFLKTALASYANDYCNSLLFVLSDIRQKTGVGDKPMLCELADAIIANKLAYGDECAKQMRDLCCSSVYGNCSSDNVAQRTVDAIRALPLPTGKVTK